MPQLPRMRTHDFAVNETSALPAPIEAALERSHISLCDLVLGGLTGLAVLAAVSVGIAKPAAQREAPALGMLAPETTDCPLADLSCAYKPGATLVGAAI